MKKKMIYHFKKGQKIKAIDPCTMYDSGEDALIVDKIYKIVDVTLHTIKVKTEIDESHTFDKVDFNEFFETV
jgi:hypothetical protein